MAHPNKQANNVLQGKCFAQIIKAFPELAMSCSGWEAVTSLSLQFG